MKYLILLLICQLIYVLGCNQLRGKNCGTQRNCGNGSCCNNGVRQGPNRLPPQTDPPETNPRCGEDPVPLPPASNKLIKCPQKTLINVLCVNTIDPVCGLLQVQCITAPCDPIPTEYKNSCEACKDPNVTEYSKGKCSSNNCECKNVLGGEDRIGAGRSDIKGGVPDKCGM